MNPIRLTIVETHPVQYNAPLFRHIARHCPAIELTVLYASRPTATQQAVGFSGSFEWDAAILHGYRWRIVRESRPEDRFDSGTFWGLDVREIGEAIRETRPHVVLVAGWHSVTQVRAIAACRRRRVPVLFRGDTHLGLRPAGVRGLLWAVKTRALLHQYAAYLAVGQRARAYLRAHGVPASRIFASPHAVDNDFFAEGASPFLTEAGRGEARRSYGLEADDFVCLFAGKLIACKRLGDAILAVAAVGRGGALLVVGEGEEAAGSRALAERLGVRARWAGFQDQHAIARAYAASDCLVLPSSADSWGLVVNEAMATGLPAVVSDAVGCAPDLIVPGETGETYRAGDVDGLAAALARVRQRGGRAQMAAACRERVAGHSVVKAVSGIVAACQSVVNPRRHA